MYVCVRLEFVLTLRVHQPAVRQSVQYGEELPVCVIRLYVSHTDPLGARRSDIGYGSIRLDWVSVLLFW